MEEIKNIKSNKVTNIIKKIFKSKLDERFENELNSIEEIIKELQEKIKKQEDEILQLKEENRKLLNFNSYLKKKNEKLNSLKQSRCNEKKF